MTNERAKSELMQLYGSLSEEKKQALDVLMAQADVTDDDIATMRILFNADIECLCNQGRFNDAKEMEQIRDRLKARLQADGEYKSNKELLCDSCYRKIAGCQAKFHNPHPVDHCIEYKPIEKQADGEYISRQDAIDACLNGWNKDYKEIVADIRQLPSVAIPSAEPKWISISERMPTKEEYIVNNGLFIVSDGNRTYAEYFDVYNSMKFGEPTMNGFRVDKCVITWMSLPKPYKSESEDKE